MRLVRLGGSRRGVAVAAATTICAVALSACSGGAATTPTATGPGGTSPAAGASGSAVPGATTSGDGAASASAGGGTGAQDGTALLKQSLALLAAAKTLHLRGTVIDNGQATVFDMRYKGNDGATGTLTLPQGTVTLLRIGQTAYMSGNKAFWQSFTKDAAAATALTGKFVKMANTDKNFKELLGFTTLATFVQGFAGTTTKVTLGKKATIRGIAAIGLVDPGANGGTLYVAATGKPYPLELQPPAGEKGKFEFLDYDKPVTLTAPPAAKVITIPPGA